MNWILLFAVLVSAGAVRQEIEIFSEENQGGNSITFRTKIPDLREWKHFLDNAKSYCATGVWHFFPLTNFIGEFQPFTGYGGDEFGYEEKRCSNYAHFYELNSVRYLGPSDTRTVAFTLYGGAGWEGPEIVIEEKNATNFPINPGQIHYFILHGGSNWTLFEEENFEGDSFCYSTYGYLFKYGLTASRSMIRDCA